MKVIWVLDGDAVVGILGAQVSIQMQGYLILMGEKLSIKIASKVILCLHCWLCSILRYYLLKGAELIKNRYFI